MRPSEEEYLTTEEVAKLFRTTSLGVTSMVSAGKLAYTKPGKKRLFPKTAIDQLLQNQMREAI
jgi:excisionase family DNA binding protein